MATIEELKKEFTWHIDKEIFEKFEPDLITEIANLNASFIFEHGLTVSDIERYINFKTAFQNRTNSTKEVQNGDILEIWSNNGKIFTKNAIIETCSYNDTGWTYCEHGSSFFNASNNLKTSSTSGGTWGAVEPQKLEYIGQTTRTIWTWGHCGAVGHGGLYINVVANRFKIVTDKKYIAMVCYISNRKEDFDYKYFIQYWDKRHGMYNVACFRKLKYFKEFLRDRGLKIGKKLACNDFYHEIIGDFEEKALMSIKKYNDIRGNLPEFAKLSNAEYTTAFLKDGIVYYCNPNVKERKILPYIHK